MLPQQLNSQSQNSKIYLLQILVYAMIESKEKRSNQVLHAGLQLSPFLIIFVLFMMFVGKRKVVLHFRFSNTYLVYMSLLHLTTLIISFPQRSPGGSGGSRNSDDDIESCHVSLIGTRVNFTSCVDFRVSSITATLI